MQVNNNHNRSQRSDLEGRRYINLVRCSTIEQAGTSTQDQLNLNNAFAQQHGMVHVDDIILDGVTGSMPGARDDIEQIIQRKRLNNDFDTVLVQDTSRLTRSGGDHGIAVKWQLASEGIKVVYAAEAIPEGELSGVFEYLSIYAGNKAARNISLSSSRGMMSSILAGKNEYCLRPPYGVDRLFTDSRGKPLHVIRNLADGTQQKLDASTGQILDTFEKNPKSGARVHYRKQANEYLLLIPGAPAHVETVRKIFRRYLIDGWGLYRIAKELNDVGIVSSDGKLWQLKMVKDVLRNPIYVGLSITNRTTEAIYNMRGVSADGAGSSPIPVHVDVEVLANKKSPPVKVRPREQWLERSCPTMENFLGEELRPLALTAIEQWLNEKAAKADGKTPKAPKLKRDKHVDSAFLLKGILRTRQDNHVMTGKTTGNGTRYYAVNRGLNVPSSNSPLRKLIPAQPLETAVIDIPASATPAHSGPAQPLETAVIDIVRDVLLAEGELRDIIGNQIQLQVEATSEDRVELERLLAKRDEVTKQLKQAMELLGSASKELLKEKFDQLENQLRVLNSRIEQAQRAASGPKVDVEAVTEDAVASLRNLAESIQTMPPAAVRQLLAALIARIEVDMETKEVELELAVSAKVAASMKSNGPMCLHSTFGSIPSAEAHGENHWKLAFWGCELEKVGRSKCFTCSRQRRAA